MSLASRSANTRRLALSSWKFYLRHTASLQPCDNTARDENFSRLKERDIKALEARAMKISRCWEINKQVKPKLLGLILLANTYKRRRGKCDVLAKKIMKLAKISYMVLACSFFSLNSYSIFLKFQCWNSRLLSTYMFIASIEKLPRDKFINKPLIHILKYFVYIMREFNEAFKFFLHASIDQTCDEIISIKSLQE